MPTGSVTLMITDIEGSTQKWDRFQEKFREALETHNRLIRQAIETFEGCEVKTIGDSFMVAFSDPVSATHCALKIQRLIEAQSLEEVEGLRVRIGIHTAELTPSGDDYFGAPVNTAFSLEAAAHGGQIVLSEETRNEVQNDLPDRASLLDTGLHRLNDLGAPVRLFLLTHPDLPQRNYPALRTLDAFPHNFPSQVTSFIGREREIEELTTLLTNDKTRLVTLIGPGGTGKTRLAMQVGAECIHFFRDGVWMIDLASLESARDVPSAVALALSIKLTNDADPRGQIVAHLREKRALLLFDNFEHVIDAARFLSGLLKDCRSISCFVTSQHLLQISGEHEFPLSPLELPPDDVSLVMSMRYAAIRLFVERAGAANPRFSLDEESLPAVIQICRRLEGLPLAVELTAALCRGLTPQQLSPRLKDRFKLLASSRRDLDDRQRSLRGALDWSYDLLTEEEKNLFAELSVFVGGFTLEALETVCFSKHALDAIFALRDKSLVRATEMESELRYSMLESIREYARERYSEAEEKEMEGESEEGCDASIRSIRSLRHRHAAYFLSLAQQNSPKLLNSGSEVEEARKVLESELANMRSGMQRYIEEAESEMIVGYGKELSRFLQIRGLYSECEEVLNVSEKNARAIGDKSSLALLLNRHGLMAWQRSDYDQAIPLFEESYALGKEIGDKKKMLLANINLGNIAWALSRFNEAEEFWRESIQLADECGQLSYKAIIFGSLGILQTWRGEYLQAEESFQVCFKLCEEYGSTDALAAGLFNYAELLARTKRFPEAVAKLEEANSLYTELGNEFGFVHVEILRGWIHSELGDFSSAEHSLHQALSKSRKAGMKRTEMYALHTIGIVKSRREEFETARELFRESFRMGMALGDRKHLADVAIYASRLHKSMNHLETSRRLQALADFEYGEMGIINDLFAQETIKNLSALIEKRSHAPTSNTDANQRQLEALDLI